MGGVPVKHHSKSKVGRRRSQLVLKSPAIIPCVSCRRPVMPHRICPDCGGYYKKTKKTGLKTYQH